MGVLVAQLCGVGVFVVVTLALGMLLRRSPQPGIAEQLSRVSHLAFWLGLTAPWAVGFLLPGTAALDRISGLGPLPLVLWVRIVVGGPLLVVGIAFMQASMSGLGRKGKGAAAFKLTSNVVATGVYGLVRNPMAFGYYAACLGGAVVAGSTWVLLYTALGVIPAHLLNLVYFEQLELSLRYGEPYRAYRTSTPFLIPRLRRGSSATD